jgi:predicted double-glycine peptidase
MLRLLLVLALLLAANRLSAMDLAVGGARFSVPVASLKELRFRTTIRQEFDFSCGSAALATLLTYHYGRPATERVVFDRMFTAGDQQKIRREGFSLLDMKRYLSTLGLQADGFNLPLQKLVDARLPAIVLISTRGYNHFVVVKGMQDGRVLLVDPAAGTLAVTLEDFERMWIGRLLFVIRDYPGQPGFNGSADWQAAPRLQLAEATILAGPRPLALPMLGPGDF